LSIVGTQFISPPIEAGEFLLEVLKGKKVFYPLSNRFLSALQPFPEKNTFF